MKSKYVLTIGVLCIAGAATAQRPAINIWNPPVEKNIRNLNVGDAVPDFKLSRIFNDGKKSAVMSDFKDQLVIFDFGNTGCKGCVEALPHMDSLQKQFGSQIRIFWVTPEYEEDVAKFWHRKNNPFTQNNNLASLVEDSTARAYFKHKSWPHEAWVYKGKLIALTSAQYVDAHNIQKVLNGDQINWPVKNDFYVFDGTKEPLFPLDTNQIDLNNTAITYAAISGYKEKVNSDGLSGGWGIVRDARHQTVRTFFINQPVYNSYFLNLINSGLPKALVKPSAYGIGPNEIVWEVKDKNKYLLNHSADYEADWLRAHAICFESLKADTGQTDKQVYQSVVADLDHLLGLQVRWEKRKEKVLALTRSAKDLRMLKSKGELTENEESIAFKNGVQYLRNTPLSSLVYLMNQEAENPYVFDETGYKENVDLQLRVTSWSDIVAIKKAIVSYGLDLKEEERLVDKLVFKEVNNGLLPNK